MEECRTTSDSDRHSRDWAYLPLPAVLLISQTISSLTDYVRFRAVCSPKPGPALISPRSPLPSDISDGGGGGGAEPWRKVDDLFRVDYLGNFAITKVTFSSELTDPDCVVMVFVQRAQAVFLCRVGDPCWTEVVRPPLPGNEPADAAYHNGVFYLLSTGSVAFYDLSKHKDLGLLLFELELRGVTTYFLVGKSGLYMVAVHVIEEEEEGVAGKGDDNYVRAPRHMVELYHIDSDERMLVKRVTDTSDTTIFYGDRNHYLAVCADDWDMLDGGSMYMQYKSLPASGNRFGHKSFSILFAKLEDGKPQPVLVGFGKEPQIFPPAAAMWFQPSFV